MQRRALLGSVAVGSAAVLTGCAGPLTGHPVQRERESSFLPADGVPVCVRSDRGDVDVTPHNSRRVAVDAVVTAPSERRVGDVAVDGRSADGEFVVEVTVDDGDGSSGGGRGDLEVGVDLSVRVPAGRELSSVRTGDGDVSVRGTGPVGTVATESGTVAADVPAPLARDVSVRSGSGDVDAWLSPAADASVSVRSEGGYVEVHGDDLGLADRRGDNAEVRGVLGDGAREVSVSSGDGTVEVWALG